MPSDMIDPSPLAYVKGDRKSTDFAYPKPATKRTAVLKALLGQGYIIAPCTIAGRRCTLVIADGASIGFVPFPSDPATPLTPEQLDSLFPPANRPAFVREIARLAMAKAANDAA